MITQEYLESIANFQSAKDRVVKALESSVRQDKLLRFFNYYAKWNSYFAGGVAQLVANIATAEELFMEPGQPRGVADRAQYIASFIFDAARDEFDDHINRQRDPHRSLAQAMLTGIAAFKNDTTTLNEDYPVWLRVLCGAVVPSYNGDTFNSKSQIQMIFEGLGYHLGSELLADQEFSIIDRFMRAEQPELFNYLKISTTFLAEVEHRDYAWIGVHSGLGGGAEADHFAWALEGINKALYLLSPEDQKKAKFYLEQGFHTFENDHLEFFEMTT